MKKALIALIAGILIIGGVVVLKQKNQGDGDAISVSKEVSQSAKSSDKKTTLSQASKQYGETDVESIVPSDAIFYLSLINIAKSWNEIEVSNFWKRISSLESIKAAGIDQNLQLFKDQFMGATGIDLNQDTLMGLFGNNLTVAVFPSEDIQNPNVLAFAKLESAQKLDEQLNLLIEKYSNEITKEMISYQGVEIVKLKSQAPGADLYYSILGDVLVLTSGNSDQGIRSSIDLKKGVSSNSLSNHKNYQKAVNSLSISGDLRALIYLDTSKVGSVIKNLPGAENIPANLDQALGAVEGIVGAVGVGNGVTLKILFIKKDGVDSTLLNTWGNDPEKVMATGLIQQDSILLSSSTSLDLNGLWQNYKNTIDPQAGDQIIARVQEFEQNTGIKLEEDVLSVIGNELCFVIHDIDLAGLFPFPKISIMLKVNNEADAQKMIDQLVDAGINYSPSGVSSAQPVVAKGSEDYEGKTINFVNVQLPYQGLSPSYAVVNQFLVIATSKETIKSVIDVASGKSKSINNDSIFSSTTKLFQDKSNQLGYMNLNKTIDVAIDITNWAFSLQKARGVSNPDAEAMLNQNIIPLLQCLKAIQAIGVEAVSGDQGVEETIFINVKDIASK